MGISTDDTTDVQTIMYGGENFLARMASFTNAKKAADDAVMALNLTKTGQAYADEQKAILDAAKQSADAAKKALDDANVKAAAIVTEAHNQAAGIIESANAKRASLVAEAQAVKGQADAALQYANDQKAEADKMLLAIKVQQQAVDASSDAIAAKMTELESAKAEANAMRDRYEAMIGKINSVVNGA